MKAHLLQVKKTMTVLFSENKQHYSRWGRAKIFSCRNRNFRFRIYKRIWGEKIRRKKIISWNDFSLESFSLILDA